MFCLLSLILSDCYLLSLLLLFYDCYATVHLPHQAIDTRTSLRSVAVISRKTRTELRCCQLGVELLDTLLKRTILLLEISALDSESVT